MPPRAISQTPGPTTRARSSRQNTPQPAAQSAVKPKPTVLPAASVGTSSGYGAPGRPVVRTSIATASTSLSSVLQNSRRQQAPIEEKEEEEEALPASRSQHRRAGALSTNTQADGVVDASEMSRNATIIDPVAGYGKRGALPPRGGIPVAEPGDLATAWHTLPRYLPTAVREFRKDVWSFLRALVAVLFLLAFLALGLGAIYAFFYLLTLPKIWAPLGERFVLEMNRRLDVHPYSLPASELERLWLEFRMEYSIRKPMSDRDFNKTRIDMMQSGMLIEHDDRLLALERQSRLHDDSLRLLQEMLPSHLQVREIDCQWEIPEQFWQAIEQRLASNDSAPLWQAFLRSTAPHYRSFAQDTVRDELQTAIRDGHIISGEMFAEAVAKNYAWLDENFKDEMRKVEQQINANIRRIASETTTDLIKDTRITLFSSKELEILAKANQVRIAYEALQQVNYFAPGLGARVDPHMTSPTFLKGRNWLQRSLYDPHPPIAALQRWEESTDCWCAAPSTKMGKAQITVNLHHLIFPDRLIIENIPAAGTLNISTAPRGLEMWIERLPYSPSTAEQLQAAVTEYYGLPFADYCEGPAPSPAHICIGSGGYDIHTEKYVQSFRTLVDTEALGLAAKTVTIRVTANWGGEATCLYRLRLTGTRVDAGSP